MRILQIVLLAVFGLVTGAEKGLAHLVVQLKAAEKDAVDQVDAAAVVGQFIELEDRGRFTKVIANLPKHLRRFPGMLVIKAGSNWSTATIVFPDGRQTRLVHLGLIPATAPSPEALELTSMIWSATNGLSTGLSTAMLLTPPDVGDPYREVLGRGFSDDDNWQTPSLVELRMPLNGQALFDVLNARAGLELPKGSAASIGCKAEEGRKCTPAAVIAPLVAAAYGLESVQTQFESASPLTYTLDLARLFAGEGFKRDDLTGCRPVYPEAITGRGQEVNWRAHLASWTVWGMAFAEMRDNGTLTDEAVIDVMRSRPDLIELAMGGVFDPAGLWAVDCTMRREIVHGENLGLANAVLRSRYYDRASRLIGEMTDRIEGRGKKEIIFFDATSHVTRSLAIGLADVVEIYRFTGTMAEFFLNETLLGLVKENGITGPFSLAAGVAGVTGETLRYVGAYWLTDSHREINFGDVGVPDKTARAFLRELNLLLYVNNRQMLRNVYRALDGHDGKAAGLGVPDPINRPVGNQLNHGFWFDLRMVLFEQGLIENELPARRQEPGYFALIDRLDGIARVGTALESAGQPHQAPWIDRVVYNAVAQASKSSRFKLYEHYLGPKPGTATPRPIMESTFDNYWHRVTLGSAYMLFVHAMQDPTRLSLLCEDPGLEEFDRNNCRNAVARLAEAEKARKSKVPLRFHHTEELPPQVAPLAQLVELIMLKRMKQAPRDSQLMVSTELNELDKARVSDFIHTQDALAKTLEVLMTTSASHKIYRCKSVGDGIKAVALKPVDTKMVFGALADPRGEHWRTLPDLFDILVGGATTAPPLLGEGGDADKEICEGIEARFLAAQALVQGMARPLGGGTSGVQIPMRNRKNAFVAFTGPEAVLFRSNARRLWLHLVYHHLKTCKDPENCRPDPKDTAVQLARQTIALADDTARWRAKLTLLAKEEGKGVPKALGFDEDVLPSKLLEYLDGRAMSAEVDIDKPGPDDVLSQDMQQLIERMSMPTRLERLRKSRDEVEAYFKNRSDKRQVPLPYPVMPLADTGGDPSVLATERVVTPKFVLESTSAGSVTDANGDTVEVRRADLVLQMPVPRDKLGAAAEKQEHEPASVDFSEALPSVVNIPFGITIEGLARRDDGGIYVLQRDGANSVLASTQQTASALQSLGVPELFDSGTHRISARLKEDDPVSGFALVLESSPRVFGVDLQPFEITLWDDGVSISDFPARLLAAYQDSVTRTFEAGAREKLGSALAGFSFEMDLGNGNTLALQPDPDAICVRLGQSTSCEVQDATPGEGLELSVHAGFTLSLGDAGGPVATLKPRFDLVWTGQSLALRGSDLLGDATQASLDLFNTRLDEVLAPFWAGQETLRDVSVYLKRGAQDSNNFQLEARGSIDSGLDCPIPLTLVLDLNGASKLEDLFAAQIGQATQAALDAATECAARQALEMVGADFTSTFHIGAEKLTLSLAAPDRLDDPVLPVEMTYSGAPGQLARGLEFDVASQTLNLSAARSAADIGALNAIVEAAAIKQVNAMIGGHAQIREISIERRQGGGIAAFGNLVLTDIPYLGDVTLPRVDLAHPNEANLRAALQKAMTQEAVQLLEAALPKEMELPFVGRFVRKDQGSITVAMAETKTITVSGDLTVFEDVTAPTDIVVNLDTGAVDVAIDDTGALNGVLNSFGPLQDGLGFGPLRVENILFGRVPGQPSRYALFFDVEVEITGLFSVAAENLMLSQSGLRLGPMIGGSIPFPVETGVVSLSSIGVRFHTGENGGKSGIELDTDITAFNAAVAKLAKIEANLDLRNIDKLEFRMDGDLIVLDSFPLMYSRGVVALQDLSFDFEAGTVPQIEALVSAKGDASLKGKESPPTFVSQTELSILRVKLSRDELKMVLPVGTTGRIDYTSETHMLIATGKLSLSSPLDFSNPHLKGDMDLDLFGWSPGGVGIDLDLRRARADIKALFVEAGITVAHADLFDPQVIIDMLLSIFDISLEDLLNINLQDAEIKLGKIGPDGSTSQDGDDGNDSQDGTSQSDQGADEGQESAKPPGKAGTKDGTEDEPSPANTNPANEGGNVSATRYCEHVYNDENKVKRYEFWLESNANIRRKNVFGGHGHKTEAAALSWHNLTFRLTGSRTIEMCVDAPPGPKRAGPTWTTILTKRKFTESPTRCHNPSHTPEPPDVDGWSDRDERAAKGAGHKAPLVHAKSPLMCWKSNGTNIFVWAQILVDRSNNKVEALLFCPALSTVPQDIRKTELFQKVCGEKAPMSFKGTAKDGDFRDEEREGQKVRIITAAAEARIIGDIRTRVVTGEDKLPRVVTYSFEDLSVQVDARPLWGSDPSSGIRVDFTNLHNGLRRTVFLWGGPLSSMIYNDSGNPTAEKILRHWFARHIRKDRPRDERAPRLVAEPIEGNRQLHHVLTYKETPGLNDLFWFDTDPAIAAPSTVVWSPADHAPVSSGGAGWAGLISLTSQLLQSDPTDFPAELQLTLGNYSEVYQRAFVLFGPRDGTSDPRVLLAGLPEGALPTKTAAPVLPTSDVSAGLRSTERVRLACQITKAHQRSLGAFIDDLEIDPGNLEQVIISPDDARAKFSLAHDPVPALFEINGDCQ
ncbi:hypothetical protein VWZ88_06005 [Phaeobacter sp. JH20_36]|uniref:hypothetical protein n=1 Tax=unclassified Phaeobacter TaxID=2621772 RepID=UPI003A8AC82E